MPTVNRKLLIGHNMWFDGFRFARELGGLACPSIAIFASDIGFSNFGQMTFLIDPKTFDPKKTPTFESDSYSIRMPRPIYQINNDALKEVRAKIGASLSAVGVFPNELSCIIENHDYFEKGMEEVLFRATDDIPMMLAYLHESGEEITIPRTKTKPPISWLTDKTFKKLVDSGLLSEVTSDEVMYAITDIIAEDFNKNLEDLLIKVFFDDNASSATQEKLAEKKQSPIALGYTSSYFKTIDGRLRIQYQACDKLTYFFNKNKKAILANADVIDFDALQTYVKSKVDIDDYKKWAKDLLQSIPHKPYFIKNGRKTAFTIEALQKHMKGGIQGVDNNVFMNGGNIRSCVSARLSTHRDIAGRAHTLTDEKTFSEFRESSNRKLSDWPEKLAPYYKYEVNSFHYRSEAVKEIFEYARSRMNINSLKECFKIDIIPDELIEELNGFIDGLKNAPTTYFEAKYQRIVNFSEFSAVIVPNDTPKDILLDLNSMGLKVVGYNPEDKMDRVKTLNRFESLMIETDHCFESSIDNYEQDILSARMQ